MSFAGNQQCQVCGGESFTTSHGLMVCDQCGTQEEHYIELQSQESIGEVDRSRLTKTRIQKNEGKLSAPLPDDGQLNNWTTYEAYNYILYEWTKALLKLGASPKLEAVTFKLWIAYLQRMGVAFRTTKKCCQSSLKNIRDKKLIYDNAESVDSSSLHSHFHRGEKRTKKKKAKPTKLDKIKDKIERKKMRNEMRKKHDSSFLNSTLTSELSKSLTEFEASMLSDSCTSVSSSHGGRSNMNMSATSEPTSIVDGSSHMSILETSASEMEWEVTPKVRRKMIECNSVVKNWIKRTAHKYRSESEKEEQHGEEEETGKEKIGKEETVEEEEGDEDYGSEARVKKSSRPKQGDISSKKPRRIPKIRKHDNKKHYKEAVKASEQRTAYRNSRLPFIMSFSKLLAILYLAVLLAEEDILLSDIIRWCREGHIPYFSAPYLLRPGMEISFYDLIMLRNSKKLPDAKELQAIAGRLAVFLSIQYIPLPPVGGIVRKFVKLLNLPEDVTVVAESLIQLVDMKMELVVPPIESIAMASIILALKVYCGLDGYTEIMLSHAATVITNEIPNHISVTPFSWQDWQKHISRLLWVCCHVDPPTAFHWQSLHDICYFSSEVFSKFFWREGMWRIPRTSCKKEAKLQILIEELLQQQGVTLEQAVMQPLLFEASQQPLHSTIEQLLQRDHATETKEMQGYIKVAEKLKEESFAKHSLNWMENADNIALELDRCGSKTKLHLSEGPRNASANDTVNPSRVQSSDYEDARGMKENVENASQVLFIPHPLKSFWKIKMQGNTTLKLSPSLPYSFRWLIGVGSKVCETPKMQILSLLYLLQGKFKKRKC